MQNNGKLTDYPELSAKQASIVVKDILKILNNYDIQEYLTIHSSTGRTISKPFPDFMVYSLISKMIDNINLDEHNDTEIDARAD